MTDVRRRRISTLLLLLIMRDHALLFSPTRGNAAPMKRTFFSTVLYLSEKLPPCTSCDYAQPVADRAALALSLSFSSSHSKTQKKEECRHCQCIPVTRLLFVASTGSRGTRVWRSSFIYRSFPLKSLFAVGHERELSTSAAQVLLLCVNFPLFVLLFVGIPDSHSGAFISQALLSFSLKKESEEESTR